MNKYNPYILLVLIAIFSISCKSNQINPEQSGAKPIQHLKLEQVKSYEQAKQIFTEKTAEIKSKTKLDVTELQQIHIITYSLEKSVAYFAENLKGDKKKTANKIAEVVENIHLDSENNRSEETKKHLKEYFQLADDFLKDL